jgi:hypothetical protein
MKTLILLIFLASLTFAQIDSLTEALKYYPLQNGNYWEYMDYYFSYNPYEEDSSFYSLEVSGDTVLSNGKTYKVLLRKSIPFNGYTGRQYTRVDTLTACVYYYTTEPVFPENEFLFDSLLADSGDIFAGSFGGHSFLGGNFFQTVCLDVYIDTIFGFVTNFKDYQDESDIPAVTYTMGKGLGFIASYAWELAFWSTSLKYAKINGVEYGTQITAIEDKRSDQPEDYILYQNYPNPFNPSTNIDYVLPRPDFVTLKVYDVLGNEIKTFVNEEKNSGRYNVSFNGNGLASGIYFYVLRVGNFVQSRKMLLLK